MNAHEVIKYNMNMARWVTNEYLSDLSDADLRMRPAPGLNTLAWQLGHLIASEHKMATEAGVKLPDLPPGFAEQYTKETSAIDNTPFALTKEAYLSLWERVRADAIAALDKLSPADLAKPTPESMREYAPTIGAMFALLGSHENMHQGQWVALRRKLGKPIKM